MPKLVLPVDHVVAAEFKEGAEHETVATIPDGKMGLDIGEKTIAEYSRDHRGREDRSSGMGRWGCSKSLRSISGTVALAKAVADSGAISVVGGGDSEKAIKSAGVSAKISHVSTGGGASLEFLSGIELPGVAALTENRVRPTLFLLPGLLCDAEIWAIRGGARASSRIS